MSTQPTTTPPNSALPFGRWTVDQTAGTVAFRSRGAFGLMAVNGTFGEYQGTLDVDETGTRGELHIQSASLDTANGRRDEHLRSADFFDVEEHPVVTFSLAGVAATADGLTLTGLLRIRDTQLEIEAPLEAEHVDPDTLRLSTSLAVDREAAGVGWSKMGMVRGDAHLEVSLVLSPERD